MKPVVDRLKQRYQGKAEIKVIKLDGSDPAGEALASQFGVQYVPTFVFLDSDGTKRDTVVGSVAEQALADKIDALK
jgi:thioredoxin 1